MSAPFSLASLPEDALGTISVHLPARAVVRLLFCGSSLLTFKLTQRGGLQSFAFDREDYVRDFPLVPQRFLQLRTLALSLYSHVRYNYPYDAAVGAPMPEQVKPFLALQNLRISGELPTTLNSGPASFIDIAYYFPNIRTLDLQVHRWSWKCTETLPHTLTDLSVSCHQLQNYKQREISLPPALTRLALNSACSHPGMELTRVPTNLAHISFLGHVNLAFWHDSQSQPIANRNSLTKVTMNAFLTPLELEEFERCPNLTSLTIAAIPGEELKNWNDMIWPNSLTELGLIATKKLTENFFLRLPPRLLRLSLFLSRNTIGGSHIFRFPPTLTDLALNTTAKEASTAKKEFRLILDAPLPENLTRLVYTPGMAFLTDEVLQELPKTLKRLDVESRSFRSWYPRAGDLKSFLTPSAFAHLPPRLTTLNLPAFQHRVRCKEAKLLPRTLTKLCVRSTPFISAVAISHFPSGLVDLEIVYDRFLGEAHAAALPRGLFFLKCGFARQTPATAFSLLPPNLRELVIMNWQGASDEAIKHMPQRLERLALRGLQTRSPLWTHSSIALLPRTLKSLYMSFPSDWKAEALEGLPKTLTRLDMRVLRGPNLARRVADLQMYQDTLNLLARTTHRNLKHVASRGIRKDHLYTCDTIGKTAKTHPVDDPVTQRFPWMFAEYDDVRRIFEED